MEKQDIHSLTQKLFREIKSLVTSFVKMLLSRNFSQKVLGDIDFRDIYAVFFY